MNASIAKARALVCACAEQQKENGLVVGTVVEIYKNLVRADECKLSDAAEREERQRFQREAIVGCRVLAGLLDSLCDEEAKKSLCERTAEVRRLSAAWLNAEKRQTVQKRSREMKMEYKLLNSNNGVIMTRAPELIGDMLYISFTGAPDKATAIFERSDGESAYRALSDGLCGIESDWLDGSMKVTVAVLDGSVRAQRWFCEGFYARHIKECGGVLVYPDDMDMQKKIAELQENVSDLAAANRELSDKYAELETKLNKLLEGYDII